MRKKMRKMIGGLRATNTSAETNGYSVTTPPFGAATKKRLRKVSTKDARYQYDADHNWGNEFNQQQKQFA